VLKGLVHTLAAAALLALAGGKPASAYDQTAALPQIRPDRIVVLKAKRQMALMHGDYVVRIYRVALGRYPQGHKRESGDSRTPEGSYFIDKRLDDSNFYKAIRISYPNSRDAAQAQARGVDPGGQIMIHGLPNRWSARQVGHPTLDWTQGCIAVTNREMDEIWRLVELGTRIDIYP
jgi:murein L,D-transpeptidase YafK